MRFHERAKCFSVSDLFTNISVARRTSFFLPIAVALLIALTPMAATPRSPYEPRQFAPVQGGYVSSGEFVLPYAPDRIILKFTEAGFENSKLNAVPMQRGSAVPNNDTGLASVDALVQRFGIMSITRALVSPKNEARGRELGTDRIYTLAVPASADILTMIRDLEADPNVEYATPDWLAFPATVPNDPLHPDHWGHNNTAQLPEYIVGHTGPGVGTPGFDANAHAAWYGSQGYGSSGIIIAIVDTGVDAGHPDLNQVAGYDYGDNDADPDDDSGQAGHGTACAGVAAAIANNGIGPAGIAGGCSIMPLKVVDSTGNANTTAITNAIYHAADNGADVISMSFGLTSNPTTDAAIEYAHNMGVVLLAGTGNSNESAIAYPASHAYVIGVGAASPCGDRKRSSDNPGQVNPGVQTDPNGYTCDGEAWWGSNYGVDTPDADDAVDVIAPTILPTTDIQGGGGYSSGDYTGFFNGTSCSAPYAAGVCALIKSKNPTWGPDQIRDQLVNTAIDIVSIESGIGWDRYSGYGMVDAQAAVVAPGCAVSPTSIDFGTAVLGNWCDATFTITNTGGGTLAGSVSESSAHYSIISGGGPYSLTAGQSVVVTVRFTPTVSGTHEGTISTGLTFCDEVSCTAVGIATPIDETTATSFTFDVGPYPDPMGWTSVDLTEGSPGGAFGVYAALYSGTDLLQEDPCRNANVSRGVWGFFDNPLITNYACQLHPDQGAVPFGPFNGLYMSNEIWSPAISYTPPLGPTDVVLLKFDVYEDLPQDNLVYYTWRVRFHSAGCWTQWYSGGEYLQDPVNAPGSFWKTRQFPIDNAVVPGGIPSGTTHVQIALGVKDKCATECGILGTGVCHSHAPLFDNVVLTRQTLPSGPRWDVDAAQLFQDNFSANGTVTGPVRIDRAEDVDPGAGVTPGDELIARVWAPNGLEDDAAVTGTAAGRRAVYLHVKEQAGRLGTDIKDPDYPYTGQSPGGWAIFVMDGTGNPNEFKVDLDDNVFTPGDVIEYYLSAVEATTGVRTYWSELAGTATSTKTVREKPMEMSCLPTPGRTILYVDDADGTDEQLYYDWFFVTEGIDTDVDRFDVRDPAGHHGNGLGTRVQNVSNQIVGTYDIILWSSGEFETGLIGDGTGNPEQSDDFAVLLAFLDNHPGGPGLFIAGDNVASEWVTLSGANAVALRAQYMNFGLLDGCHENSGFSHTVSVEGLLPGTIFQGPPFAGTGVAWKFYAAGVCPQLTCFDVLQQQGLSTLEMTYDNDGASGAVLRQETLNPASVTATVQLTGFSYPRIHDVPGFPTLHAGPPAAALASETPTARNYLLFRSLESMGLTLPPPATGVGDSRPTFNRLSQNYPNPFNPVTTIAFEIKETGEVTLEVFDVSGRRVKTLLDHMPMSNGVVHQATWDGTDNAGNGVSSGIYFYRLLSLHFEETRKMVLLK